MHFQLLERNASGSSVRPLLVFLGRKDWYWGSHNYHVTFYNLAKLRKFKWLEGRNYCREMCMDLISIETKAENDMIKSVIAKSK